MSNNWIFPWGNSVRIMGIHTSGPAVKKHISSGRAENWLQYIELCAIRCPWFIHEFLYNAHTHFSIIFITGFRIWCQPALPEQHIHHWTYWWRLHQIHLLNERPPDACSWSGERLTRKQTTSRPDNVWPDVWKHVSDAAKKKAKQRWAIEKPKFDNARQLSGTFFIEPNDEEFKLTLKAPRRKEVPMPAAVPCKIPIKSSGATHRTIGKRKTKIRLFCWCRRKHKRPRLEGAGHKPHQDYITAKGMSSITHHSLVHKLIPMPQALKIPDAKAAVEKEWGKLEKIPGIAADESETRKSWSMKQGIRAEKFILRHWWISVIWRIRSWNINIKSTKAGSYSEVTLWKMIWVRMQCSLNKDHQHRKWQPPKSWISSPDCQVAMDKQQMHYPLIPKWKWKMLTNCSKIPSLNVQIFGYVYRSTNGPNHGPVWKTQSFLSKRICTVIFWQDCYGRKLYWNTVGKKF